MGDTIEYREKVMNHRFMRIFVIAFLILTIVVLALTVRYSFSVGSPLFAVVMALPFLFAAVLLASFRSIKITITSKKLIVNYGFFHKSLFLHEIESCEQVKADFKNYAGLGVRRGMDKSTAYLTSFGNAVKINKMGEKAFVFSTNQPDKVCHIISTKKQ